MSRTRRIIAGVVIGAAALVVLLLAAFVVFTTPGAKLALAVANQRDLPVRALSIDGTLARRFALYGVEVRIGPLEASIDTVVVGWRPLALLAQRPRRLHITELTLAHARVLVKPDSARVDDNDARAPSREDSTKRWIVEADRVRVRNASVEAPGGVRMHGVDVAASGGPDGFRADVRASGSAWRFTNASAFIRASGNTNALTADSLDVRALGGVVRGDGFVRWDPALSWRGRLHGDSLRVGELADSPEDWLGAVSFRARGTGSVHEDSLRIGIDLQSLEGALRDRPLSARGRVDIDRARIAASDASVSWGSARATLSGSTADVADVTLDASIPSLAEILPRARGSASVRGRITGTPERIEVDVEAGGRDVRAGRVDVPNLDVTLDATLAAERYVPHAAEVRRADVRIGEGRLDARGKVAWRDGIEWDGSIATDRFETSTLTPARWNLYGPVSIRATTNGVKRARQVHGRLAIETLSGTIRDLPLSGSGSVALAQRELDLSQFRLEWGDTEVTMDGHAGDTLSVDFHLVAPNLAVLDSSLAGSVSIEGRARGTRRAPGLDATVAADSVRVREYRVHHLEGEIDADVALASPAKVWLLALGASRGETTFDTVRVDVSGPRDAQRAALSVVNDDVRASVSLRGTYADSTWSGWIEDVRVRLGTAAEWMSSGRAPVFVSRSRASVDSLDIASGPSHLYARAHWQRGDTTHVAAQLHQVELVRFQHYLADGMEVTGSLEGTAVATVDPAGRVVAEVDMVPGPGVIAYAGRKVAYAGRATGRADASGVVARVDLSLEEGSTRLATVDADVSIPGFVLGHDSLGAQPIEGRLDVDCRNIGPVLAAFDPTLAKSSGVFTVHVTPEGTAGDFRLLGKAALEKARIDLRSGLRLRDTEVTVMLDGHGNATLDGAVTSGGGRVSLKAASARSEKGWVNGTFTAKGERFQIVNQPDAQVFVSPDLQVEIAEQSAAITGRLFVPFARIETSEVPASATTPSSDVVFVEDTLATKRVFHVRTQVRVELGDSVSFNGFGLSGRLTGGLAVDDETGRPTQGTGELHIVDGKYRAFGNELKIDPGRLVFGGGAIDNPGLDVRAYRGLTSSQNVMTGSGDIVGVNLRGTLRKPEFSVFSNPPMSESEIMSYLVLGRPASTGSGSEQSALASAALLLGMQKGTNVAGDLGKKLTLDDAYIDAGSSVEETSFVAGKYLSAKLYVSYAAGLFEHTNTFRTRYSLTSKWTLQTESGTDATSTDLMYWFERGK